MNRNTSRSFLGCRALIVCRDGGDTHNLKQQLERLGITSTDLLKCRDAMIEEAAIDMVFFDLEGGRQTSSIHEIIKRVDGPAVALIGSDAPSSVNWVIEQGACAYLMKPLRGAGVLASLVIAFHTYSERRKTANTIADLRRRVGARDVVCSAALHIMRVFDVTEDAAFKMLRISSMERRMAVEDVAAMIASGGLSVLSLSDDVRDREATATSRRELKPILR